MVNELKDIEEMRYVNKFGPNPDSIYPNENIKKCLLYITTYPFNIMGNGWEKTTPTLEELPLKGDTVVGNDVWIGQNVTVMPGVHIGDGSIIAANSVVTKNVPPYHIAGGNPCKIIKKRFDDELIDYLLKLKWWDWSEEKIFKNLEVLCSSDLDKIKSIK